MATVKMRPTWLLDTQLSEQEVIGRIKNRFLAEPAAPAACRYAGQFARQHAMISIAEPDRHFWSPWMHLEIRSEDDGCVVAGRFSPHPAIWTGIMFSFFAIACLTLFAAMFGVSQQLSGETAWAYLVIPLGLLVAGLLWGFSKVGQRLAHEEMHAMRAMIEKCLND